MEEILNKILNTQEIIIENQKEMRQEQTEMKEDIAEIKQEQTEMKEDIAQIKQKQTEIKKEQRKTQEIIAVIEYNEKENTEKLLEGFNLIIESNNRCIEEIKDRNRVIDNGLIRTEMQNKKEHNLFNKRIKELEMQVL